MIRLLIQTVVFWAAISAGGCSMPAGMNDECTWPPEAAFVAATPFTSGISWGTRG